MIRLVSSALALMLAASTAYANLASSFPNRKLDLSPRETVVNVSTEFDTNYFFDQLIDHNNPSAGTFKQRYFFSDEFWAGPGSPIVLVNVGEQSADGFNVVLSSLFLSRGLMELYGAAGVVLEHRYYGQSSPYDELTTANLQWLTVDQAVEDTEYFVRNVKLPWSKGNNAGDTTPASVPWVNAGCSYPGLLVAYGQEKHPTTFAASWATSAPVQANGDFWQYWEPVEEGLPSNCTADLASIVQYIDATFSTGTPENVTALKTMFSLQNLPDDDFAEALTQPWGGWQDLKASSFATSGYDIIFQTCDAIETLAGGTHNTAATGVGMPLALQNYAAWWASNTNLNSCPDQGGNCSAFYTYNYNDPMYTDWSVGNAGNRQWTWLMCNELGWFEPGDPGNKSSIVSAYADQAWSLRQCDHMFPNADGSLNNYTAAVANTTNSDFQGWNLMAPNMFVVNGQYDPWRAASLSSDFAPALLDVPTQDIHVTPGAHHCWDFYLDDTAYNQDVVATQNLGIQTLYGWLNQWYAGHPNVTKHLQPLPDSTAVWGYLNKTTTDGFAAIAAMSNPNNTVINETPTSGTDSGFWHNKGAVIAAFIVAGLVVLAVLGLVFYCSRRAATRRLAAAGVIPRWATRGGPVPVPIVTGGDTLGEYGTGGRAGGRGEYHPLKARGDHVHDDDM